MCVSHCGRLAEEPEGAGQDEKVPEAGGAGVPHEPDRHSGAAGGAGEELPDHLGRLQEDHRETRVTGLIGLTRDAADDLSCTYGAPTHQHRP